MTREPVVKLVPRITDEGGRFTDVLIIFDGRHFATRLPWVVADTPRERANQAADFLERQRAQP